MACLALYVTVCCQSNHGRNEYGKPTRQSLHHKHPSLGLGHIIPCKIELAKGHPVDAGKLTASREELPPTNHFLRLGSDPRIGGKVRFLLQFVCVYHQTQERP